MIGTLVNTGTILAGSLIGGLFRKIMSERINHALFIAMGLAAFGLGINTVVQNMPSSKFPVLFIISLALGGASGTLLDLDGRVSPYIEKIGWGKARSGNRYGQPFVLRGNTVDPGSGAERLVSGLYLPVHQCDAGSGDSDGACVDLWNRHVHFGRNPVMLAGKYLRTDNVDREFHYRHHDVRAGHRWRISYRHVRTGNS